MKFAVLLALASLPPTADPAVLPVGPYLVEIEVYVRDERLLCEQAHAAALERFGPGIAEIVTRTYGEWDVAKCLAVIFQTAETGDQVVSAGIDVRKQQ